jgi:hypothetical protein
MISIPSDPDGLHSNFKTATTMKLNLSMFVLEQVPDLVAYYDQTCHLFRLFVASSGIPALLLFLENVHSVKRAQMWGRSDGLQAPAEKRSLGTFLSHDEHHL